MPSQIGTIFEEKQLMSRQPERFWDRLSSGDDPTSNEIAGLERETVDAALAHLSASDTVLDVGCGTGGMTLAMGEHVASIEGIDISGGMIKVAQERAAHLGRDATLFSQRDLFDEGLTAGGYSAVTVFNVLHYIFDMQTFSERVAELLAPGGLFISATACMADKRSLLGSTMKVVNRFGLIPKVRFYTSAELEQCIVAGGLFELVESRPLSDMPDVFVAARKRG